MCKGLEVCLKVEREVLCGLDPLTWSGWGNPTLPSAPQTTQYLP